MNDLVVRGECQRDGYDELAEVLALMRRARDGMTAMLTERGVAPAAVARHAARAESLVLRGEQGATQSEVAQELGVDVRTVKRDEKLLLEAMPEVFRGRVAA